VAPGVDAGFAAGVLAAPVALLVVAVG
jgi:hypothetical protein